MAGEGERMQLRSMVDKDKENNRGDGTTQNDGEGSEDTQPITTTTSNPAHEWSDGLDDIDRAVRISTKKVEILVHTRSKEHSAKKHCRLQTTTPK